jgi:hypothetical protein
MINTERRLLEFATLLISTIVWSTAVVSYGNIDGGPVIQISSPASNSIVTAGASVTVVAFQADSGAELRYLSVYAGSLLLGSVEWSPAAFTWPNVPAGIHVLTAVALDVNGRFGTSAPVPIQVISPPPNDDWQNATAVEGINVSFSGTLFGATAQEGETLLGFFPRNSIWWRWTAPVSGKFTIVSGGDYPEIELAVAAPFDDWASRREILGVFRTNNFQAMLTFAAEQDVTYWIATFQIPWNQKGVSIASPTVSLQLRPANPPPNDEFANAIVLASAPVQTNFTSTEAVQTFAEEQGYSGPTLWFNWQPSRNGVYRLWWPQLLLYSEDAVTHLWTGTSETNLSLVWGKHTGPAGFWPFVFQASATNSYYLSFRSGFGSGDYDLRFEPVARPLNDDFSDRLPTGGSNVVFSGDFTAATPDPDQPGWMGDTLWWSWTAPSSGRCRITNEPNASCAVAVFEGTAISNLVPLLDTNQFSFDRDFYAEAGATYQVALWSDYGGSARLTYVSIPPNDAFMTRQPLSGSNISILTTLTESTIEADEPFSWEGNQSIWYTWTAPATGPFSIFANSPRTILGVYTGSSLVDLTPVPAQAGSNPHWSWTGAAVHFDAIEGTSYQIQLLRENLQQFTVRIAPRPINDDFADRIDISGTNVGIGSAVGATVTYDEYCEQSIWWKWTAPSNGSYTLSTAGSDPYRLVRIRRDPYYYGEITAVCWSTNGPSAAHFSATNGQTFSFAFCGNSNAVIHLAEHHAPVNDNFADRLPIASIPAHLSGTLFGATAENFEFGSIVAPHSVWYTWIAPSNGLYGLSSEGSDLDVHIDLFVGNGPGSAGEVFLRGRLGASGYFAANAGTVLHFRISQDDSSEGNFQLRFYPVNAANDGCSMGAFVSGPSFSVTGTNLPSAGSVGGPPATCWTWTAPQSGIFKVNVIGDNSVTVLQQQPEWWEPIEHTNGRLRICLVQGTVYRFVVDASQQTGGPFTLNVSYEPPPPNDNFENRFNISQPIQRFSGSSSGATFQPGEPDAGSCGGSGSVWWSWRCPTSRRVRVTAQVDEFYPFIMVYRGASVAELQSVPTEPLYNGPGNGLSFQADAGVEYQIRFTADSLSGNEPFAGPFTFAFDAPSSFEIVLCNGNKSIQLRVEAPPGVPSVLDASTDLVHWLPIQTNLNLSGTIWFSDPDVQFFDRRFYRIR